ncbi:MAG: arsenic efflux protein [bacterium]|nr:arsenic efflux protein [bacterium]
MLISILEKINNFNEWCFSPIDGLVDKLPFEEWALDAIIDSVHLLPLLFIIFVIIELLEFYFSDKIDYYVKKSRKSCVAVGSLASILPQCGFSVISSSLYSRKLISMGCLIAVYLGTSDETIPILLAHPNKAHLIIPIVGVKLLIAVLMGYFIDLVSTKKLFPEKRVREKLVEEDPDVDINESIVEEGCCNHNPATRNRRELILHPLVHTINIFAFILVITFVLNYALESVSIMDYLEKTSAGYLQPVITAFVGLIPNCAVSIALTMMLIKGTISFGACMSGLLANAGLGLLVLLKNNDFKDTIKIICILLAISILSGITIEFIM